MTFHHPSDVAQWDATDLLQMINPDNLSFCCVGYAPSQRRRCRNPIAQHNRQTAMSVLASIPKIAHNKKVQQQRLSYLAGLMLCRRYHQCQAEEVVQKWCAVIDAELIKVAGSKHFQGARMQRSKNLGQDRAEVLIHQEAVKSRQQTSGSSPQSDTCRRSPDQGLSEHARQKAEEEAALHDAESQRRQEAQRQREEREAESRRKAKRDENRQRAQRQNQERREHLEQEARAWASSWAEYEDTWVQILRLKAMASTNLRPRMIHPFIEPVRRTHSSAPGLPFTDWHQIVRYIWPEYHPRYLARSEDPKAIHLPIKDMIPWPVRGGAWQDVNERNVEEFFEHTLVNTQQNGHATIKLLRAQSLRWHPDRMLHLLGTNGSEDVMSRVTLVAQVVNGMVEKAREVDQFQRSVK